MLKLRDINTYYFYRHQLRPFDSKLFLYCYESHRFAKLSKDPPKNILLINLKTLTWP